MIVSVSRRTDVPAFYGRWFRNRLRAGRCRVVNPFNPRQVSTVELSREAVDAFVFWTRNPVPFTPVLDDLDALGHPYVFLVTLTGYGPPLEPGLPPPGRAVAGLCELSRRLGPRRVTWRYDPVVLGPGLEVEDHLRRFATLAEQLAGATDTVILSFLDRYRKTLHRLRHEGGADYLRDPLDAPDLERLVAGLAETAARSGMRLQSCAEEDRFAHLGLHAAPCIDGARLAQLFGITPDVRKDPGQRALCRCSPSRDIGVPDTCLHGCVYCYATSSVGAARSRHAYHRPGADALVPIDEDERRTRTYQGSR